jgi:hypothetical protein
MMTTQVHATMAEIIAGLLPDSFEKTMRSSLPESTLAEARRIREGRRTTKRYTGEQVDIRKSENLSPALQRVIDSAVSKALGERRESDPVDSTVEKVGRGARLLDNMNEAIAKVMERDGVSRARAAEIVSYSQPVTEALHLEQDVAKVAADRLNTQPPAGTLRTQTSLNSGSVHPVMNNPGSRGAARPATMPGIDDGGDDDDDDVSAMIDKISGAYVRAGMSRTAAVDKAVMHPDVTAAFRKERQRKLGY